MKWRLVKLVRDNVQKHVPGDEPQVEYRPVDGDGSNFDEDYTALLIKKLGEETVEFLCDSNAEELGDVLTVVLALGKNMFDMAPADLMAEAAKKNKRMGKFDLGMGMYVMTLDRDEYDAKLEDEHVRAREAQREEEGRA
jgi:predicted house-cleaning noncanonical NTP pyrophosphatase (MazG superfamily)